MSKKTKTIAQYEANKISGRGFYCPHKGVYKIMRVKRSRCYGKPALMAIAFWKPTICDNYDTSIHFLIQLESFKLNAQENQIKFMNPIEILFREIIVGEGSYAISGKFSLKFEISEKENMILDEIDACFGGCGFNSDDSKEHHQYSSDVSEEEELIEYANALIANGIDFELDVENLLENPAIDLLDAIERHEEF